MGFSEYTVRPEVDYIFKTASKKYRLLWVSAPYPQVKFQFEGRLRIAEAKALVDLFPDSVYVEFEPNIVFPEGDAGNSWNYEEE